ncbi:hypothetical protein DFH08DRAFT_821176 [Mycena albidolilacea]|uniref:Uncharacterized protein n=1 Tax=Mycena albidolilacea TaxID=1033008 RepID=A0AAD7EE00_9AGAR|nr:hypothetical protein DFH08DRAFT_821176 [Mycena albidolilacea]
MCIQIVKFANRPPHRPHDNRLSLQISSPSALSFIKRWALIRILFTLPLTRPPSTMAQNTAAATIAPTSQQEMEALVTKVTALSKLALDMTRLCIEVNDSLPAVIQGQIVTPAQVFYHSAAPLPDEIDAMFPPGLFDNQPWHVVCVGRRPGLYASHLDADDQVRNIPNQSRKRKDTREEALIYYRTQYRAGECERVSEAPPASFVPVPTASGSRRQ